MAGKIIDVIDALRSEEFFGAGEFVELAKGKKEYTLKWEDVKRKIKRQWLSKKK